MISTELKKLVDPKNECCCEYHLANKCKEWAYNLKQEIIIKSYTVFNAGGCGLIDKMGCSVYICDAKTEPEAIFKACEWIREQTK